MPQPDGYSIEENILRRSYAIRSYEVNAGGRLSIPSIFNLLQDAASSHALKLGVSVPQLLASNYTWVLSRIFLKMNRYPGWGDTIQVHTWPSGIQRVFALRDFDIRQEDCTIGACVSAWIIIDAANRHPIRPTSFARQLNPVDRQHVLAYPLGKLPLLKTPRIAKQFSVRYRDLDINQHVNNACYIEWLLECIPGMLENGHCLSELEVNFLGEALQGDSVLARCCPQDEEGLRFAHDVLRETDGRELVRARTTWLDTARLIDD
jgi:medium-chain acyl-[acyl-carrier-protein] hydrolase